MHFNIYLDDETGAQLKRLATRLGTTRNALIREAMRDFVSRKGRRQWSDRVLRFTPDPAMAPFESLREETEAEATRDPLA